MVRSPLVVSGVAVAMLSLRPSAAGLMEMLKSWVVFSGVGFESARPRVNVPQVPSVTGVPLMVVISPVAPTSSVRPSQGVPGFPSPVEGSNGPLSTLQV